MNTNDLKLPASDSLPTWMSADLKMTIIAALDAYLAGDHLAVSCMVREEFGYRGGDAARATRRYKAMLVSR